MSLIMANNKVSREQLAAVDSDTGLIIEGLGDNGVAKRTPEGTATFTPIPHALLVDKTHQALDRFGFTVEEEEHALACGGNQYFGGFAITGEDIKADDRKLVVGLRNAHDKRFSASICIGNQMLVCENLCFSSDVKLSRKHTTHIIADLDRVLSDAVARVVSHWSDMSQRIEAYKLTEVATDQAADLLVKLVDAKAFPKGKLYDTHKEFRNPRHEEFKGNSLWTLYNGVTEMIKGGDITRLASRTMKIQGVFDRLAGHTSLAQIEADKEAARQAEDESLEVALHA